ncbi:MAG: hypothetical protein RLZZ519_3502 [Bacteroidota bacterium]|jgi:hypothetical protein
MKTSDSFAAWADWYRDFQSRQLPIDWNNFDRIPPEIHPIVANSVRQFQLGESSEARNLKAKVSKLIKKGGDPAYQDAMDWFIFEENRHSRLLGRFMAMENMPKAESQFTDKLFRLSRHAFGLRNSLMILVSAELIAVPYYTALKNATRSPILTTICDQILRDESMHIRFQAKAIAMLLEGKSALRRKIAHINARIMLEAALDVVWFNHADLLRLYGYQFADLRRESLAQFNWAWAMINGLEANPEPKKVAAAHDKNDALESGLSRQRLSRKALWADQI